MNKIKCPICKGFNGIYSERRDIMPYREFNIKLYCERCGLIGDAEIILNIKSVNLQTKEEIEQRKIRLREESEKRRREMFKTSEFYHE